MIFRVAASLVSTVRTTELLTLVRNAAVRGHTLWFVDTVNGVDTDEGRAWEEWASGIGESLAAELAILREAVIAIRPHAATLGTVTIGVEATPHQRNAASSCDAVLDVVQAIRLAAAPLVVMVEDLINDSAFLRRALPPAWRAWVRQEMTAGAITMEHGGGKPNMRKFIEQFGLGTQPDPAGLGPAAWRASHIFLLDRDAPSGQPEGHKQATIRTLLNTRGEEARLWVLDRRSADHYVPEPMLDAMVAANQLQQPACARAIAERNQGDTISSKAVKRAFAELSAYDDEDAWFDGDGSRDEMTRIAEWISAHL